MPSALPKDAEKHYVPGCVPETIRNLTAAAERGEFGYGVVAAFIKAVEQGLDPRFSKTRPVPVAMLEAIRANPDMEPRKIVYVGLKEGRWDWADVEAFEENADALAQSRAKRPSKTVYLTRSRRARVHRPRTTGAFAPKISLDAVCDHQLSDGAKTTLALIMARAGRSAKLVTYTSSLATQLGRTTRTLRNHFAQLEEAGLIRRRAGTHVNTVEIEILEACRPEPYQEPEDIAAYRTVRSSPNPSVRLLAETIVMLASETGAAPRPEGGGRKGISAFNPDLRFLESAPRRDARLSPPTSHSTLLQMHRPPGFRPYDAVRRHGTQSAFQPNRMESSTLSSSAVKDAFSWR